MDPRSLDVQIRALDPLEMVRTAVAQLQDRLPGWVPRNASLEVIYLEAVSIVVAELVRTADEAVAAAVESLLSKVFGVARLEGIPARGTVDLRFDTPVSVTVPAGTTFLLPGSGEQLLTDRDQSITLLDRVSLDVSAAVGGGGLNGTPAGTPVDLIDAVPNTLSATLGSDLVGGADPEDDAAYIARCAHLFARLSSSLVTPVSFADFALESGQVSNAVGIGAWNGTSGTPGSDGGHVTVAVWGLGAAVPRLVQLDLQARMAELTATGTQVHVIDAKIVPVDVAGAVAAASGADSNDVHDRVLAVLEHQLNPERWTFGAPVRSSVLLAAVQDAGGVDHVSGFTPAQDVVLDAHALPRLGSVTGLTVA